MGGKATTEKISVTIPRDLASEIRKIAAQGEISSFFTEALQYYIAYRKQQTALVKGFGAWKDKNHPELAAPEDTSNYVRAIREADLDRLQRIEEIHAK